MTWFDWLLIGLWVLVAIAAPLRIDQPRAPINRGVAAVIVMFQAALIAGLLWSRL